MTTEAKQPEKPKPTSLTQWKRGKVHEGVTLPSSAVVSVQLPNLADLIKKDAIPNTLLDAALESIPKDDETSEQKKERLIKQWDFLCWAIPETVVSAELKPEDVSELPFEDVEMLAGFIQRTNDIDAVGHQLGGLEVQDSFREHRGIASLAEIAAGL